MSARDRRDKPVQLSFLNVGVAHLRNTKQYEQLLQSDEGLFRKHILPLIPFDLVQKLYSEKPDVRPANHAITHVAAAIFVLLTGLTEERFIAQIPWNLKYQFALGIEQWDPDIPFGEKTFSNLRKRIATYNKAHPGEDIWDEITHSIDMQIAEKLNLFSNYNEQYVYGLRLDSLMIRMHAQKRPRLDIIYSTIAMNVFVLKDRKLPIPGELEHYLNTDDYRSWVYFKGLPEEYQKEGLPEPTGEKKLTTAERKEAISDHRIRKLLGDAEILYAVCIDAGVSETDEFQLLERMISDQALFDENGHLIPKDKKSIRPDSMQSPYEPEATYRFKAGSGYHGYAGFIVDLFNNEGTGIIVDRRLEQNTYSDQAFMRDFQEKHDPKLNVPEGKRAFLSVDAGFISTELNRRSDELGYDVFCAGIHGSSPDVIFADFVLSDDKTHVVQCPAGNIPTHCSLANGSIRVRFKDKCCETCINKTACGAITTGKTETRGSSYVIVSEAKITAAICVKMRSGMEGPDIVGFLNKRNAIEGINSVLRRRYEIDFRHTPGIKFARHYFYTAITCYNIMKFFAFLRSSS